ncbi:MAG: DUF2796 domain-containing protein [Hyphomicrobiales bacterium]
MKQKQKAITSFILAAVLLPKTVYAEQRQVDGHVHGLASLNLVVEHNKVWAEFEAAGADIVGFEHAAETPEQMEQVRAALALLKSSESVLALAPSAKCILKTSNVELHGDDIDHDDHDHKVHSEIGEEGHTEFHVTYQWTCAKITHRTKISFPYFENFKQSQQLRFNRAGDLGQASTLITKDVQYQELGDLPK